MPRQAIDNLGGLGVYIIPLLKARGRKFDKCEECLVKLPKKLPNGRRGFELHHTKYDGATIDDLMVVCLSCNRLSKNKGLA